MGIFSAVLTFLLIAIGAGFLWKKTATNRLLKLVFWPALILRLLCGLLLGYLYSKQIITGGDTWGFQRTGELLTNVGRSNFQEYLDILVYNKIGSEVIVKALPYPTYTNSFFQAKIVSLLNFLTSNNYYLNSLLLSTFGFIGCWYLVIKLGKIFPGTLLAAIVAFLFFPSVVFWNSGVMKDGILLSALGFFWGSALQLAYLPDKGKLKPILILLLSAVLLWKIKFFVAAFVYSMVSTLNINRRFFRQRIILVKVLLF